MSSSRETCTLGSVTTLDYSIEGGVPPYRVTVDGRVVERLSSPDYITCRRSAIWSPLEALGGGSVQRISVSVSDRSGARVYAIAELRLVPHLPAPTHLKVTSGAFGNTPTHFVGRVVGFPTCRRERPVRRHRHPLAFHGKARMDS